MNTIIQGTTNTGLAGSQPAKTGKENPVGGFGEVLQQAIGSVNKSLVDADAMAAGLASGQHANIHETMIALEKADISFRLATKVQGKAIDAYKEVMRLQL